MSNTASSQGQRILRWLKQGKSLSPLQALKQFGCFRLGARIYDLKRQGHNIVSKRANRANFHTYKLAK